jgi:hypothetical protein
MRTRLLVIAATLALASAAGILAQVVQYDGKLLAVEKTRIQVEREAGSKPRQVWVGIADDTPVVDGDRATTFLAAKLKKNAVVAVTVVPFDGPPPKEWSCTMHPHVAEAVPGKCAVCAMALVEREKAALAKEVRVTKR